MLERLTDVTPTGPSLPEQVALVEHARERGPEIGRAVDCWLLFEIDELRQGLTDAQANQAELKKLHARLTSAPWSRPSTCRAVDGSDDKVLGGPPGHAARRDAGARTWIRGRWRPATTSC